MVTVVELGGCEHSVFLQKLWLQVPMALHYIVTYLGRYWTPPSVFNFDKYDIESDCFFSAIANKFCHMAGPSY